MHWDPTERLWWILLLVNPAWKAHVKQYSGLEIVVYEQTSADCIVMDKHGIYWSWNGCKWRKVGECYFKQYYKMWYWILLTYGMKFLSVCSIKTVWKLKLMWWCFCWSDGPSNKLLYEAATQFSDAEWDDKMDTSEPPVSLL